MSAAASNFAYPPKDASASRLAEIKHRIDEATATATKAADMIEQTMNRIQGRPMTDMQPEVNRAVNAPTPIQPTLPQIDEAIERNIRATVRLRDVAEAVAQL